MAKYSHTILADFRITIAKLLGDSNMVFWESVEIDKLIEQALLTFGGFSAFWKKELFITTVADKYLYDIFIDANDLTDIKPSITFGKLISWLNIDLIENLSTENPTSDYLTLEELLNLIVSKYNLFQLQTQLVLTKTEDINVPPQQNEINLGNNITDLVRVTFVDDLAVPPKEYILKKVDEAELSYIETDSLSEEGIPAYYSTVFGSPNDIKLYPIPQVHGILKIISVNGFVGEINEEAIINLPNNLVPYLKYGVLSEIYSKDGIWNDPGKKAYCESRWQEGIMVGKNYNSFNLARVDGLSILMDSLHSLDLFCDYIKSKLPPTLIGVAGFNIFGLDLITDVDEHSIGLVTNLNAPIPINDLDNIDIAEEYIDCLKAYVVHLAQTKCGIYELSQTSSARKELIRQALNQNARIKLKASSFDKLMLSSKKEEIEVPRIPKELAQI